MIVTFVILLILQYFHCLQSPTKGGRKKKEEEKEVWKWWEEEPHPEGVKWLTLEHKVCGHNQHTCMCTLTEHTYATLVYVCTNMYIV